MTRIRSLDPHERPPDVVRLVNKKYQKLSLSEIDSDKTIIDPQSLAPDDLPPGICLTKCMPRKDLRLAFDQFAQGDSDLDQVPLGNIPVFTHQSVSGQHLLGFGIVQPRNIPNQYQACS